VDVLAAASSLVMAVFAIGPGPKSPLRVPLALIAADAFAWTASSVSLALSGDIRYRWVSTIASPLFVPFALHFVLLFVGRSQKLKLLLWGTYALFCAKSLHGLVHFLVLQGDLAAELNTHRAIMLVLGPPFGLFAIGVVAWHALKAGSAAERRRAILLLLGLVAATLMLPTSWISGLGVPVPPLSTIGILIFNFVLAELVLGVGIVAGDRRVTVGLAVLASLAVIGAYIGLFQAFSHRDSLLLITTAALTLALGALARLSLAELGRTRETLQQQATLGRFSAQLAHDLKNPLSAAIGAAEVLAEDLRRKNQPKEQELAQLVVQQLERIDAQIDRYQRLSKFEPSLRTIDLNALVRRVLALQPFAATDKVVVRAELADACPPIDADPELLASALENLMKNAFEATPQGTVTVSTAVASDGVRLSVRDTGAGMDPRVREQAFTPFATTKAKGSGLGLAFVRQVARAHGGDARLDSAEGAGTVVEVVLPLRQEVAHG
jgi:signal transduction histidine kinase